MNTKYFVFMVGIFLVACSGVTESPKAVMTETEIREWQAEALAFADRNLGAWPDLDLSMPEYAEDAIFSGPSGGFLLEGKPSISHFFEWWTLGDSHVEVEASRVFISVEGAAFDDIWHDLWYSISWKTSNSQMPGASLWMVVLNCARSWTATWRPGRQGM
jgi:hypothetical protein